MTLLYVSYWNSYEMLTESTIIPHLQIAAEFKNVTKIVLVTTERQANRLREIVVPKVKHIPLRASSTNFSLYDRLMDFIRLPILLRRIAKDENVSLILAKGVLAGQLAYRISKKLQIPFITESFEPHADYMAESDEWRKSGIKYMLLKKWERSQIQDASKLFTVSVNYARYLRERYGNNNISTVPCCVNTSTFSFSSSDRQRVRQQLNLGTDITGIYVGKFGGIYYDEEAFMIFAAAFQFFADFRLIILSPDQPEKITRKLVKKGIDPGRVTIKVVPHVEVSAYLSAADFAFSTIKPASSRKYCCPVKNGEYWANGLPVLLTSEVGDDSQILETENGGALFSLEKQDLALAFSKIRLIMNEKDHRQRIKDIALKHRSFSLVRAVYEGVFMP